MKFLPVVMLLGTTVCLGLIMGYQYLRGIRRRQVMIGFHFLLGAGGLEALVMVNNRTPDGDIAPAGLLGNTAAVLFALALVLGVVAVMIGRGSRRTATVALAIHASVASSAFIVLLVYFARLLG